MQIDYLELGKRIKKIRKAKHISQEKLAEKINVSVPHMSNIENGKTKLSLQVLVNVANELGTTPDILLLEQMDNQSRIHSLLIEEIGEELVDCTPVQVTLIKEAVRTTKNILKQYDKKNRKEY